MYSFGHKKLNFESIPKFLDRIEYTVLFTILVESLPAGKLNNPPSVQYLPYNIPINGKQKDLRKSYRLQILFFITLIFLIYHLIYFYSFLYTMN